MDKLARIKLTIVCVALAGAFFFASVLFDKWFLFPVAAFFDWLPLPTGWMRLGGGPGARRAGAAHGAVTLVAYGFGAAWLLVYHGALMAYLFLTTWLLAVLLGAYTTALAVMEK